MGIKIDTKSLSIQLIALVLIVTIVPVVILTYYSSSALSSEKYGDIERIGQGIGDNGDAAYEQNILNDQLIANKIAGDNRVAEAINAGDNAAIKQVLNEYKSRYPGIDVMTIADENGVVMGRSTTDLTGDKTSDATLQQAITGTEVSSVGVMVEAVINANNLQGKVSTSSGDGLALLSAVPIKDDSNKVVGGVLCADLQNSRYDLMDSIASTSGGYCSVYQGDTLIATSLKDSNGNHMAGTKLDASIYSQVQSGQTVQGIFTDNGRQLYKYVKPMEDQNGKIIGALVTGYDVSDDIASINNMTIASIGIGAFIAVLAALAGFFVVTRTTKPINKLVAAANSVAAGDLETSIDTGVRGGEVGQLTTSIAKMVGNIKDRILYNESILKGIMDPLFVVDTESKITYVNEPGARLFCSTVSELQGKKFGDQFQIVNSSSDESALAKCLRTGEATSGFETRVRLKNGKEVITRGSNAPIKDASGRVNGVVELLQDITREKEAEIAIKKAETEAKEKALFSDSILKSITDAHFVTDTRGSVTYINEVAQKLLGIGEREALGRPVEDVIGVRKSIARTALIEQKNIYNVEGYVTTKSGHEVPIIVNATLLKDINGQATGVNTMFKDITKEKAAKKQLSDITLSANKIAERVSGASGNVASSVQQVMSASKQISESIQQIASGSQNQAKSIESVNKLMHDMSNSISSVMDGAKKTSEDAIRANAEARKGSENAKVAIRKMDDLHVAVNDSAKIVQDLGEKSKQIGQIVEMITAIAGQTNLLALNAAIEAARAGDAGRGFAVVAEEVRKLAEESAKAAEEINSLIGEVREQTARAVESMKKGTKEVDESNKIVAESLKSLEDISRLIDTTAAKAQEIATMTEKQAADTQRVVKDVEEMAAVIEESAAGSEEVSASSEETTSTAEQVAGMAGELAKIAEELKAEVSRLKVE